MAGVNRKHGTNCTWCGETIWGSASYVHLAKVVDGRWSRMTVHPDECRDTYIAVMQDNGYTVKENR
jgi:hypothetical protein